MDASEGVAHARFGYLEPEWQAAGEEIHRLLVAQARAGSTISYEELASRLSSLRVTPDSRALALLLREISIRENAAGRGMLSALVVRRAGRRMPGAGFFKLAQRLGRDISDPGVFWETERTRVIDSWRSG